MAAPIYSMKTARNGRVMYFKDNQLVSQKNIPETAVILDRDFIIDQTVDEPTPPTATVEAQPEPEPRVCVACGEYADRRRFLNMKEVWLCEDHYHQLTLGEVAQAVRERSNGEPTLN